MRCQRLCLSHAKRHGLTQHSVFLFIMQLMQLHYQSVGTGQPLIFIHGLFGSGDNWRSVAKHFSQSYQVISLDLRNHGRSPHSDMQNYALMAADLLALYDTLQIEKAHLVGHSVGGKVAMQFAHTYPDRVKQLVVVDMATRAYADEHTHLIDALLAIDLKQYNSRSGVDAALKNNIKDTMVRQFLLMNLARTETGLEWRLNLQGLKQNYPHLQAAVCQESLYENPCLFIKGARSNYIQEADISMLRQQFSRAQFKSLDAAHWVHAEQPQTFITMVEAYII